MLLHSPSGSACCLVIALLAQKRRNEILLSFA
jgi:hypothetical protein